MLKPNPNVFDLVHNMFERNIEAKPHYLVACSLWALHTHVFREFEYTPRFALLSPVPESGKSEVLYIFKELSWEPQYFIDPTPASVIRMAGLSTLLIDEADNMLIERSMRSVLNDGHKASFEIYPQNMWWPEKVHRSGQQNLRCYVRQDFEAMWRRYATTGTTAIQSASKVDLFHSTMSFWFARINNNSHVINLARK